MNDERIAQLLGPTHLAKRAVEAVSAGEISEERFGKLQQQIALMMFPQSRSVGEALSKFFGTEAGRLTLAPRTQVSPRQNYELMKRERSSDDGASAPEDISDADDSIAKLAERYRAENPEKKLSQASAVAHIIQHDPHGRQLYQIAKVQHLKRNA